MNQRRSLPCCQLQVTDSENRRHPALRRWQIRTDRFVIPLLSPAKARSRVWMIGRQFAANAALHPSSRALGCCASKRSRSVSRVVLREPTALIANHVRASL